MPFSFGLKCSRCLCTTCTAGVLSAAVTPSIYAHLRGYFGFLCNFHVRIVLWQTDSWFSSKLYQREFGSQAPSKLILRYQSSVIQEHEFTLCYWELLEPSLHNFLLNESSELSSCEYIDFDVVFAFVNGLKYQVLRIGTQLRETQIAKSRGTRSSQ